MWKETPYELKARMAWHMMSYMFMNGEMRPESWSLLLLVMMSKFAGAENLMATGR